ncbi:aromatic ring-hydroxylating oxygenase subunit alpha [Amycolatopsis jejuensis]|uniref:aromatic ring-hydroxylating oxygenase subunit alpha n=1 Tax=Amycolatopsis jejuensis TaxID=330084 RepID=UPI0006894039|nr:aromatic ring-hydroxylating dioxygenase subunit alpha [Amycolatopsis jejuensis]
MTTPLPSEIMRGQMDRQVGIPRELYLSQDLFDREVEAIFHRSWLFAGHESQLSRPGDFVTVDVGAESVVVSRTDAGALTAFHNLCRHRGARLVDAGCGHVRQFVCPYHQWTYRRDGTLRGAPKMPSGFDPAGFPLRPVPVASWHGLVFVHLAAEPAPLAGLLGAGGERMAPFDLAGAVVAHTITYDVAANWKIVWENAQECYHCSANHPELIKTLSLAPLSEPEATCDLIRSADMRMQYTRMPLRGNAVSLTLDGRPASAKLMGDFGRGADPYTAALHLKPTFAIVASPDYAVVVDEHPVALDHTRVRTTWLVRADAEPGEDYDLDTLIKVWDETNRQDWDLCERTQRGVRSRLFEPGPLSGDEPSVAGFHHAYTELLAAAGL